MLVELQACGVGLPNGKCLLKPSPLGSLAGSAMLQKRVTLFQKRAEGVIGLVLYSAGNIVMIVDCDASVLGICCRSPDKYLFDACY